MRTFNNLLRVDMPSNTPFQTSSRRAEALSFDEWTEMTLITRLAFDEHAQNGLNMLPCNATYETMQRMLQGCQVFLIKSNEQLVAFNAGRLMNDGDKKYLYRAITSVHPNFKRRGLGKMAHNLFETWARENGCSYLVTDTSCKAHSSHAYHKAMGFEDWQYASWPNTNYYTVILKKDLTDNPPSKFQKRITLIKSYICVHLKWDCNGKERLIYRIWRKLFR